MIYAVVSEFNPFHNGHQYLLKSLPLTEDDYTVCIMSGSFVQRGEPAMFDKWARAKAAILGGADLILELPIPFVLSDADRFCAKGVEVASKLGQPVTMAFGVEDEDLASLEKVALISEKELEPKMKELLAKGLSYGAARQGALETLLPKESRLLHSPNNLLGAGYIRACKARGLSYRGILRSSPHDGEPVDQFAAASFIRAHLEQMDIYCPIPQAPVLNRAAAEVGMLTLLKGRSAEALASFANVSEGLENRIVSSLSQTVDLKGLYDEVKTKRYSHAKLRRAIACCALGISKDLPDQAVPYLRVLAFSERGRALLKSLKNTALLPLCQSGKECLQANPAFFEAERFAADLWNGWSQNPLPCGEEYRRGALFLGKKL